MFPLLAERERGDRGETLVEVLVSVVILGIAGVAIIGGMTLSVKASDIHRKETTGGAYVRSFAEAVENYVSTPNATNYKPCAAQNAYMVGSVTSTLNLPTGYTASQDAVKSVSSAGVAGTCPNAAADTGVQQVTLRIVSADTQATQTLTIVLRKPCDPSVAVC